MVTVSRSKCGIRVYDVWYAQEKWKRPGIVTYYESKKPLGSNVREFGTLVSNLQETEDALLTHLTKNCRYEANRAAREGVEIDIHVGTEVSEQLVEEFCDYFVQFWASKGYGQVDINRMKRDLSGYREQNALAITKASLHGKVLVYHTHIVDSQYVRLLHSASHFRNDTEIPRALVGMANRYLHKEELLYFKNRGNLFYDWGGAGETEDVKSITEFKKSFGGESTVFYNGQAVQGIFPRMAYWYLNRRKQI